VITWCAQLALQLTALPVSVSIVQALPSLQVTGQLPSQVSPLSTTLSPQNGEQSLSLAVLQPAGQQPSPFLQVTIGWKVQAAEQLMALPVSVSVVQALPSLHVEGQLPSQVSPLSTIELPQLAEQSLSLLWLQPAGQQPSPLLQVVMAVKVQAASQVETSPVSVSVVQALPSLQEVGQCPSQVSPGSIVPLPQDDAQSESFWWLQPAGQHPSPPRQALICTLLQTALQVAALPTKVSVVQALPSSHELGQVPSQTSPGSSLWLPQVDSAMGLPQPMRLMLPRRQRRDERTRDIDAPRGRRSPAPH
jgi:hypothetical protein